MAYIEITTTNWSSRLGSSFSGMGIGLVLLMAGTVLLWWNEGDFVATRDALDEAQSVGTGFVCTLLGAAWSLVVISIAWLRFRPAIGGLMAGLALVLIVLLYLGGRGKRNAPVPPAAQAARSQQHAFEKEVI